MAFQSRKGLCGEWIRGVDATQRQLFGWSGQHGSELWIALNAVSYSQMAAHVRIALPI